MGVAAGAFDQVVTLAPTLHALIGRGAVAAVDAFPNVAEFFPDDEFGNGTLGAKGMSGHCGSSHPGHGGQQDPGGHALRQSLRSAENQKIPVIRAVFLPYEETQAVGLGARNDLLQGLHGVMVGDAYAVQAAAGSVRDDLFQRKPAAGRNARMDMKIDKHDMDAMSFLGSRQILCSD